MSDLLNVVWFKRDLRIEDNQPLALAARAGKVLPLYIVEPEYWQLSDSSPRHWHFIHDCLVDLQKSFSKMNVKMIIRIGEATEVLEEIKNEIGRFTLWSHEETGNNWTYQRDIATSAWCQKNDINME